MKIEHVKILAPRKAHLLASADVMFSDSDGNTFVARDFRVVRSKKDNSLFVGEPEYSIASPRGPQKWSYEKVIEFSGVLRKEVCSAILQAFAKSEFAASA